MTQADVYRASKALLQALDTAPVGTGTVLKDQSSKDWMETSVLRGCSKLNAAAYHTSNVSVLVQDMHKVAAESAARIEKEDLGQTTTVRIGGCLPVQKMAYEVDAFLAATRACIDFAGSVLAVHLGMNRRTSITELLKAQAKKAQPPFAFLLAWMPWIKDVKNYRDECVHYRTLRAYSGYETVRKEGRSRPRQSRSSFPRSQELGRDRPDTRRSRALKMDNDPEGMSKIETWGSLTRGDGRIKVLEHSIRYEPNRGYMRVEEFCRVHLGKLREFAVNVFEEAIAANFKFQQGA